MKGKIGSREAAMRAKFEERQAARHVAPPGESKHNKKRNAEREALRALEIETRAAGEEAAQREMQRIDAALHATDVSLAALLQDYDWDIEAARIVRVKIHEAIKHSRDFDARTIQAWESTMRLDTETRQAFERNNDMIKVPPPPALPKPPEIVMCEACDETNYRTCAHCGGSGFLTMEAA